ncbi:MAG: hypothetical protein KatS3mg105_4434 [Gemmatales bacterium]|nr:MAG: hypothetical protein KatS3mg105_4434 [Gemmatales bacterium]
MFRVGVVVFPEFHSHEVDDAGELAAFASGDGTHCRLDVKFAAHLFHASGEIGTGAVELVDKRQSGNIVPIGLTPDGFALYLYSTHCTENAHCSVEDAQAAFNLGGEIHMAWRVDQIDLSMAPADADGSTLDGNAFLGFQRVVIRGGGAFIHIPRAVFRPGEIENAFGERCFPPRRCVR